jgi:peroxiredoxin
LTATGSGVTAIGTGGRHYAKAFIEDEAVPFQVLLDKDGEAADVIILNNLGVASLMRPDAWAAGVRSVVGGNRQRKLGARPTQLGATLVIGPGDELLYVDKEAYAGDHADLDEVITVLEQASTGKT